MFEKAEEEVERRIKHDRGFSTIKCNYVIDNNGSAEETIKEIEIARKYYISMKTYYSESISLKIKVNY